jgi:protein involved in polysaccharide export with SLBB domain
LKRISWLVLAISLTLPGRAQAQEFPQAPTGAPTNSTVTQPSLGPPGPPARDPRDASNRDNSTMNTGAPFVRSVKDPDKHILAPGDQVDLFVRALPQEEKTYSIRLDGYFYYPLIGDVRAAGLTIPQLSLALQQRLSKVLWNPKFKLGLHSVVASQITVLGEVVKPGRVDVTSESTVLEAIQQAGGLSATADPDTAVLTRGKINIDVPLTLSEGLSVRPMSVKQGDVIYVLPGRRVTVVGEVWKPGIYSLSRAHHSPLDAIRIAGGAKQHWAEPSCSGPHCRAAYCWTWRLR